MSDQPEALRLADALVAERGLAWRCNTPAAAELRRLHAANLDCVDHYEAIKEERDALLEALKPFVTIGSGFDMDDVRRGRAAIAKAEGA